MVDDCRQRLRRRGAKLRLDFAKVEMWGASRNQQVLRKRCA